MKVFLPKMRTFFLEDLSVCRYVCFPKWGNFSEDLSAYIHMYFPKWGIFLKVCGHRRRQLCEEQMGFLKKMENLPTE